MKISILLLMVAIEPIVIALDVRLYTRNETLPRGDRSSSKRLPPPNLTRQTNSSPPDSPRTAGLKADEAEMNAQIARVNFKLANDFHSRRMREFIRKPEHKDPDIAHHNRMSMLKDYRAVPKAKEAQYEAYMKAGKATGKAGRYYRQERYKSKAIATAVAGRYHHANLDMQQHVSRKHQQINRHIKGAVLKSSDVWVKEAKAAAQQADKDETNMRQVVDGLLRQTKQLRRYSAGRDTDSEDSS